MKIHVGKDLHVAFYSSSKDSYKYAQLDLDLEVCFAWFFSFLMIL